MRMTLILSAVLFFVASASPRDDKPPPNEPQLWRASAAVQGEETVVQIARPEFEVSRKAVSAEAMKCHHLEKVTLSKSLRAFGVEGKYVGSKVVLEALREPKSVAVFVRFYEPLLDPDPFYLRVLREGTIVFVVAADAIFDPVP